MAARVMERRRDRRIGLEVQVEIRPRDGGKASTLTGRARNVSLAGVYAIVPSPCPLKGGETVSCTVNVPPGTERQFPFVRLLGTGWVVRAAPFTPGADEEPSEQPEVGVAIAFTSDVTALGTLGGYR